MQIILLDTLFFALAFQYGLRPSEVIYIQQCHLNAVPRGGNYELDITLCLPKAKNNQFKIGRDLQRRPYLVHHNIHELINRVKGFNVSVTCRRLVVVVS